MLLFSSEKTKKNVILGLISCIVLALLAALSITIAVYGIDFKTFILALILLAALVMLAVILAKPQYGILLFLTSFLFTYPSFLQGVGKFTPNNLLGLIFCFLLLNRFFEERNLWFLGVRQIQLMLAIGCILLVSLYFAPKVPAALNSLSTTNKELWDFFTQFAFLIFMIHFIRTRFHLKLIFGVIIIAILVTVPSGIYMSLTGEDYRAAATFGIRAAQNSNHLAFYCLFASVSFWYLQQELESPALKIIALITIGVLLITAFLCASRSAFLNVIFLSGILILESAINPHKILVTFLVIAFLGFVVLNFVPKENLDRITTFSTHSTESDAGSSGRKRLTALKVDIQMFADSNPLLGVGPGNYRWIRQLYYDHIRLATHNSYLWALLSGGIFTLLCYLWLFWTTWRDLRFIEKQPIFPSGPSLWMIKSMRTVLLLYLLFSFFAEVWNDLMTFLIIGLSIIMKKMYEDNMAKRQMA